MKKILFGIFSMLCFCGLAHAQEDLIQVGHGKFINVASYNVLKEAMVTAAKEVYDEAYGVTAEEFYKSQVRKRFAVRAFNKPVTVLEDKLESIILQSNLTIVDNELRLADEATTLTVPIAKTGLKNLWDLMSGYIQQEQT